MQDGSCTGEQLAAKETLLESALGGMGVTVTSLTSRAPPAPPPAPPPLPLPPRPPPGTPPGQPLYPPTLWFTRYYDGDCQETGDGCPRGCQRSLWSEMFTWDGQRDEIGGGPLPGFRSNVTIKRCQTVLTRTPTLILTRARARTRTRTRARTRTLTLNLTLTLALTLTLTLS